MLGWLIQGIQLACAVIFIAIMVRVLFSWIEREPRNPVHLFSLRFTDPILAPLRRFIPPLGGFDLTPLIALFALSIIAQLLGSILI